MILPDYQIRKLCQRVRDPLVSPLADENIQPASIDLRLGSTFKVFRPGPWKEIDLASVVDVTDTIEVEEDDSLLLQPNTFVLGCTLETVCIPDYLVSRVEGKSSLGRLGLFVHVTAGFIDPGFHGRITLEMLSVHPLPLRLRPGQLIAQASFHEMTGPAAKPYQGDETVASSRYGR